MKGATKVPQHTHGLGFGALGTLALALAVSFIGWGRKCAPTHGYVCCVEDESDPLLLSRISFGRPFGDH